MYTMTYIWYLLFGLGLLSQQVSLDGTNVTSTDTPVITDPPRADPSPLPIPPSSPTTPSTTTPSTTTSSTDTPTTPTTSTTLPTTSTTSRTHSTASATTSAPTTPPPTTNSLAPKPTAILPKTIGPPVHIKKPSHVVVEIEAIKEQNMALETENQRLKIGIGILTAIIIVAVLFTVLIIYLRRRNGVDMRSQEKSHRPTYFRPVSTFKSKTERVDPAMEYLQDDRLFVNDLDKEMETFKLNRGTNVMTSEL